MVVTSGTGPIGYSPPADIFNSIAQDSGGNVVLDEGGGQTGMVMVGVHTPATDPTQIPDTLFSAVRLISSGGQYGEDFDFGFGDSDPDNSGIVNISFNAFDPNSDDTEDEAKAALVQPDGTILIGGSAGFSGSGVPLALLNSDGSLDTSNYAASGRSRAPRCSHCPPRSARPPASTRWRSRGAARSS